LQPNVAQFSLVDFVGYLRLPLESRPTIGLGLAFSIIEPFLVRKECALFSRLRRRNWAGSCFDAIPRHLRFTAIAC
jgi:hypothetical protein